MSESDRASRSRAKGKADGDRPRRSAAPVQRASTAPAWLGGTSGGAALGLGGVQRQVKVGENGDSFERQAESVAQRVASGGSVAPDSISQVASPAGQRAPKTDEKKPPEPKKPEPVQKAAKPDESKPTEKLPEPPKPGSVQKAAKADLPEKKPEPTAVQKAEKVREKGKDAEKPLEEKLKGAPVQRAPLDSLSDMKPEEPEKEPEPAAVQMASKDSTRNEPSLAMEDAAQRAIDRKDPGHPLPDSTRDHLEQGLGVNLGDVRVHDDETAQGAAGDLEARAFTHGSDIWLGHGESPHNIGLMAHEATHVVQQTGAAQRMLVQRAAPKSGKAGTPPEPPVEMDLPLPVIKSRHRTLFEGWASAGKLMRPAGYDRGKPDQRSIWMDGIKEIPEPVFKKMHLSKDFKGEKPAKLPSGKKISGTYKDYVEWGKVPQWDRNWKERSFQVDHMIELQVADEGAIGPANTIANLELFDSRANTSAGATLKNEIRAEVADLLKKKGKKGNEAEVATFLRKTDIVFKRIGKGVGKVPEADSAYWTRAEIEAGKPFQGIEPQATPGKAGGPELFALLSPGGALVLHEYAHGLGSTKIVVTKPVAQRAVAGLIISKLDLKSEYHEKKADAEIGSVAAAWDLPEGFKPKTSLSGLKLYKPAEGEYTGALQGLPGLTADVKGMSEIVFKDVRIRNGELYATGLFIPSIPIFGKRPIEARLRGRDIEFALVFTSENIKLPVPGLNIDTASVAVFMGTQGLGVEGGIDFSVERLGSGSLGTRFDTVKGFSAEGSFNFDSELFDKAEIRLWYREQKFGGEGTLAIEKPNKIKGIKAASVMARFDDGRFTAEGKVQPSIPGIKQADLMVAYQKETGLEIGGVLTLADNIPGISSGSVEVNLKKLENGWKVRAAGKAVPKIPGVSSQISITYDDGAFDIAGTAGYDKGLLKGSISIGATNRPIGPDGKPAAEAPGPGANKITLYGGGSLTLRLAPWLEATAGVRLLPNGEIEVTGRIGLPAVLEIFKEKKLEKNIFKIGIDIPIVGVAVAGQRIGIFANISGGLDLDAGIGPGQLQDLHLEVTYNPAHEEQTRVGGAASLHIPAHAGLRMFVRGSLGVGIPIVSASAGIEVGGGLGLEGALNAGVNVDWTPTKGLDLTASAEIFVEPKLKFDITGFVLVEADLFVTTIELYAKRWQLASMEYGSGLRFGLKLPIHYQEGKPFDISFSDVQFILPDISPSELLPGLIKKIA